MDEHEQLVAYLADRDVACTGCGYNLRGIRGGRCPECNEDLVLRVGLAEPRLGAVVASLAGSWCCAGMTGALLFCLTVLSVYFDDWAPLRYWMPGIVGFVVSLPYGLWIGTKSGRRWLRGRSGKVRLLLVAGTWFVFAGCVTSFAYIAAMM